MNQKENKQLCAEPSGLKFWYNDSEEVVATKEDFTVLMQYLNCLEQ